MRSLIAALALVVVPGALSAQELAAPRSIQFPGSFSFTAASGEPTEPNNVAGSSMVSQGVSVLHKGPVFVVGFMDVTMKADSEGYEWNNTMPYRAGAKLVLVDSHGVLEAAVGVMGDGRESSTDKVRRTAYLSYWRGWRGDALSSPKRFGPQAFPGYAYASSGYVTSREADNWITAAAVEQGVTVYARSGFAVSPFAKVMTGTDSENRSWNRRSRFDAGVKVSRRILNGVVDGGVARRRTYSASGREVTSSTVVFVDLWIGWTPRAIFN